LTLFTRRRIGLGAIALLGATAVSTACGSPYRAADGPVEDGGADAPSNDEAASDEAASRDGAPGNDGGAALDAAGLTRCEMELRGDSSAEDFFCTDFEDTVLGANGVPEGWSELENASVDGRLGFIDDAGVDGSRALDVVAANGAGNNGNTFLTLVLSQTKEANTFLHYQMDFDFRLLASDVSSANLGLLVFTPASSTQQHGIAMYGSNPASFARKDSPTFPTKLLPDSPPAQWHHAHVTLDRGPADTDYFRAITIDGMDVDGDPSGHAINAGAPTALWLGLFATGAGLGSAHAQFDNVVLRRRPQ
jgi:hypothetical protein